MNNSIFEIRKPLNICKISVKLLNVKLPFIEAVEYLKTDSEVLGCICLNTQRPCAITLNELSELRVIENNFFENFSTKFISPKFTYDEITGNFIVEKDVDGNVIYEEPRIENNESLLQFYNERLIENSDVFVYSGASGNSEFEGSLVKPLQVFVK